MVIPKLRLCRTGGGTGESVGTCGVQIPVPDHRQQHLSYKGSSSHSMTVIPATLANTTTNSDDSVISVTSDNDSDNSVDFRVRSPGPSLRLRIPSSSSASSSPSPFSGDCSLSVIRTSNSSSSSANTELLCQRSTERYHVTGSDSIGNQPGADKSFVTPKKKFRRIYEEQQHESKHRVQSIEDTKEISKVFNHFSFEQSPLRVEGCIDHGFVTYECHYCLEVVAKRFGWPSNSLTPSSASGDTNKTTNDSIRKTGGSSTLNNEIKMENDLDVFPVTQISNTKQSAIEVVKDASYNDLPIESTVKRYSGSGEVDDKTLLLISERFMDTPLDLRRKIRETPSSTGKPPVTEKSFATPPSTPAAFTIDRLLTKSTELLSKKEPPSENEEASILDCHQPMNDRGFNSRKRHSSLKCFLDERCTDTSVGGDSFGSAAGGITDRRELANERERLRVKHLTSAFQELSACVSPITAECLGTGTVTSPLNGSKFTKVAVLRTAAHYIGYLSSLLQEDSRAADEEAYDQMRRAIVDVMSVRCKRGREEEEED